MSLRGKDFLVQFFFFCIFVLFILDFYICKYSLLFLLFLFGMFCYQGFYPCTLIG